MSSKRLVHAVYLITPEIGEDAILAIWQLRQSRRRKRLIAAASD